LDAQIDARNQVAARPGGADAFDVLDGIPLQIPNDAFLSFFSGEDVIERQFESFLSAVIDVCEAEDMSGYFSRGVVTTILALQIHTGNLQ
jgi:hypothetical protein